MKEPKSWTQAELAADAAQAREIFRRRRMEEPLELYTRFFETFVPVFSEIIDRLPLLSDDAFKSGSAAELVRDPDFRTAFRYLAAPPVSEDDLKTLADSTLSAAALQSDAEQARRVRDTVLHIVDPHRFPGSAKTAHLRIRSERGRSLRLLSWLLPARSRHRGGWMPKRNRKER